MGVQWTTRGDFIAECEGCDWKCYSRNALGVAAQHAKRHGHYVRVTIERTVIYDYSPGADERHAARTKRQ